MAKKGTKMVRTTRPMVMRLRGLGKATVAVAVVAVVVAVGESMVEVVVDPVQMQREALCDGACSGRAAAGVGR
jgi:hypothetical protein